MEEDEAGITWVLLMMLIPVPLMGWAVVVERWHPGLREEQNVNTVYATEGKTAKQLECCYIMWFFILFLLSLSLSLSLTHTHTHTHTNTHTHTHFFPIQMPLALRENVSWKWCFQVVEVHRSWVKWFFRVWGCHLSQPVIIVCDKHQGGTAEAVKQQWDITLSAHAHTHGVGGWESIFKGNMPTFNL